MQVVDRANIRLRVWERGAGETLACGTGACAAVVAASAAGCSTRACASRRAAASSSIAWPGDGAPVMMTGPAATVFEGKWEIPAAGAGNA